MCVLRESKSEAHLTSKLLAVFQRIQNSFLEGRMIKLFPFWPPILLPSLIKKIKFLLHIHLLHFHQYINGAAQVSALTTTLQPCSYGSDTGLFQVIEWAERGLKLGLPYLFMYLFIALIPPLLLCKHAKTADISNTSIFSTTITVFFGP